MVKIFFTKWERSMTSQGDFLEGGGGGGGICVEHYKNRILTKNFCGGGKFKKKNRSKMPFLDTFWKILKLFLPRAPFQSLEYFRDQLSNLSPPPPPRNDQLSYLSPPPAKMNKLFKKTSANGSRWMFCL